jgi:7-cyano-7-deazaguanine synthase
VSDRRGATAVVLVSGGMDSCVVAAMATRRYDTAFLHVRYGQRAEARERRSFEALADHFGVTRRLTARLDHLKTIGGSSLTDSALAVPTADLERREIPPTYVPFRNGQLLAVAAAWAEVLHASRIFVGAVEEDSSGYPDCRRSFFDLFEKALSEGTRPETKIAIETPIINMPKSAIVSEGITLGAPFNLTWSCYREAETACGVCDSCALRLRAFREAGVEDPIQYQKT